MTKICASTSKSSRRTNCRQGVVVSDRLPGRFPDSVEYKSVYRISGRKKGAELIADRPDPRLSWTCF